MEIVERWEELSASPKRMARLRRQARQTAKQYVWSSIRNYLLDAATKQLKRQAAPKRASRK